MVSSILLWDDHHRAWVCPPGGTLLVFTGEEDCTAGVISASIQRAVAVVGDGSGADSGAGGGVGNG